VFPFNPEGLAFREPEPVETISPRCGWQSGNTTFCDAGDAPLAFSAIVQAATVAVNGEKLWRR